MSIELALMSTAHVNGTQVILAQINMPHISVSKLSVAQTNLAQLRWFIWSGSNRFGLCELGSNGLDQV